MFLCLLLLVLPFSLSLSSFLARATADKKNERKVWKIGSRSICWSRLLLQHITHYSSKSQFELVVTVSRGRETVIMSELDVTLCASTVFALLFCHLGKVWIYSILSTKSWIVNNFDLHWTRSLQLTNSCFLAKVKYGKRVETQLLRESQRRRRLLFSALKTQICLYLVVQAGTCTFSADSIPLLETQETTTQLSFNSIPIPSS